MAGSLKPNPYVKEGLWVVNNCFVYGFSTCGLFNGLSTDDFQAIGGIYWSDANSSSDYLDITLKQTSNIWCLSSSNSSYAQINGKLKISKYINSVWVDVTAVYPQIIRNSDINSWTKFISNLPSGSYRFQYGTGARFEVEWFIEDINNTKSQLKSHIYPQTSLEISYPMG